MEGELKGLAQTIADRARHLLGRVAAENCRKWNTYSWSVDLLPRRGERGLVTALERKAQPLAQEFQDGLQRIGLDPGRILFAQLHFRAEFPAQRKADVLARISFKDHRLFVLVLSTARRFPTLPLSIAAELRTVEPSGGRHEPSLYPCAATLRGGGTVECLYLAEASAELVLQWGWPDLRNPRLSVPLEAIVSVRESQHRLPCRFANQLYEAGESCMGATFFQVLFRNGDSVNYSTGNLLDFVDYPPGKGPRDVVDVVPHGGRGDPNSRSGREYHWCLFAPQGAGDLPPAGAD